MMECPELRNRVGIFQDRSAGGRRLAALLEDLRNEHPLVLAIPAGGVPVAVEIARALGCELDVAAVSKITLPTNTEVGYGAVAFDGSVEYNTALIRAVGLRHETVQQRREQTLEKVQRRMARLRGDAPFPDLEGRTVILVDDGLASGFTMKTALQAVRRKRPRALVVAVPTAHTESIALVLPHVAALYCVNVRSGWSFAVADAYRNWYDVSDEEAETLLRNHRETT